MPRIYRELNSLIAEGKPCALATLVDTSGSSPQNAGARMIFLPDGRIVGTIGGGCLEAETRRIALDCLRTGQHKLFDLQLDDDFGWDDGLICGGSVRVFIDPAPASAAAAYARAVEAAERREPVALCTVVSGGRPGATALLAADGCAVSGVLAVDLADAAKEALASGRARTVKVGEESIYVEPVLPRPTLVIAGAGHVGSSLAQIASLCDFEVVIVDDRAAFASRDRLPFADRVEVADIPTFLRGFPVDPQTYLVIVTRGHRHDAHCLREVVRSNAAYVGMIGSKRKIVVIYEELLREGLATKEELLRVHAPLGLTLGDREVGEIAVSIMAELIAVRRGADLSAIRPMQYSPPILA